MYIYIYIYVTLIYRDHSRNTGMAVMGIIWGKRLISCVLFGDIEKPPMRQGGDIILIHGCFWHKQRPHDIRGIRLR